MSKINRFAVPAFALAAALSVGSAAGLAQTKTTPAQWNQIDQAPRSEAGSNLTPAAPMGPG